MLMWLAARNSIVAIVSPLVFAAMWQAGACQSTNIDTRNASEEIIRDLPTGSWSGERISMFVTNAGARIEFECASGTVEQKITLTKDGSIETAGTYTKDRGGPRRGDTYRVLLTGRVDGKKMSLNVTLSDSGENIGSFELIHGRESTLSKCL